MLLMSCYVRVYYIAITELKYYTGLYRYQRIPDLTILVLRYFLFAANSIWAHASHSNWWERHGWLSSKGWLTGKIADDYNHSWPRPSLKWLMMIRLIKTKHFKLILISRNRPHLCEDLQWNWNYFHFYCV